MKTIYLLITIVTTFTSCIVYDPVSYIPVMPNNPMFEKQDELLLNGGISFDHVEGQIAVSPLQGFGITGGLYNGTKGINIYEAGLVGYKGSDNLYASFAAGAGGGGLKGEYRIASGGSEDDFYRTDIRFSSYYMQPSIYYCLHISGATLKLSGAIKLESVNFSNFNISFINKRDGATVPNFSFTNTASNPNIRIITPYLGMRYEYKQLFLDIQYGNRNVQNTFQARQTSSQPGGRNIPNPLNSQVHPLFDRGMANVTIGLKFSSFNN